MNSTFFTDLNECLVNICQHGGSCLNTLGSFRCQCLPGWSGQYCERGMISLLLYILMNSSVLQKERNLRGCDRMVVAFITNYAISGYHH